MFIPSRLDRYVREGTRRTVAEVRDLLSSGAVRVNGAQTTDERRLIFEDDDVALDGARIAPPPGHAYLVLNKPLSVTSTAHDPRGRADLGRFLERMPAGTFPVGRLDRMTSGALLFTTDGDLAQAVLHPDHRTEKLYWLGLTEHVGDDDPRLAQLTQGVPVLGRLARATRVCVVARGEAFTELHVTLIEGMNRQIRRMARALGLRLDALHRESIGPLTVDGLSPGQARPLVQAEVEALWEATGGRELAVARRIEALVRLAESSRGCGAEKTRLEAWLDGRLLWRSRSG
jgi:23S rRNA pseudouridine2605 synthase